MNMTFVPCRFCFEHGVQNGDHFSHGNDKGDFVFFAFVDESVEKKLEGCIASYCIECRHVQGRSDVDTTAPDVSFA